MKMPGFNAEASLYRTRVLYSANGLLGQGQGGVRPQSELSCEQDCAEFCDGDCGDLPLGANQAACARAAARCFKSCTRGCEPNRASRRW